MSESDAAIDDQTSAVGISVPQDKERLSGSEGQEKRWEMTGMDRQRREEREGSND